ncbi:MAG: SMP-30/gluconolactonase/LRE family protein [Myxococcales bacterium]|nr:SMP-30/gluconolactonase/LRE family protein [Myxococcales bacterium]
MRRTHYVALALLLPALLYFFSWPVPVEPVAWQPPANPGYSGPHARNSRLGPLEELSIGDAHGPEDLAIDGQGRIYAATHDGRIVRLGAGGEGIETVADTGGRPLGIEIDRHGNVIVADALRGLLSVAVDGSVSVLADEAEGVPIRYADDLDIGPDGRIYLSDASTKFGAAAFGGTYEASLLDINEHGGHGRLIEYDPATRRTRVLLDGLNFANGVAVSHSGGAVLVCETGNYRVLRYWLKGRRAGQHEVFIDELPGFPDNISRGLDARYWLALVSPRNAMLDALSGSPFARKVIQRLPAFVRPEAQAYGHVLGLDGAGAVLYDLQRPDANDLYTSVSETGAHLYLGSLTSKVLRRLSKAAAKLPVAALRTGFSLRSEPAAGLVVDGELRGITPITVDDLEPGQHELSLQAAGYQPWRTQLHVAPGEFKALPAVHLDLAADAAAPFDAGGPAAPE